MSLDANITQAEIDNLTAALGLANISTTILVVDNETLIDTSMTRVEAYKVLGKLIKANSVFRRVGDSNRALTLQKLNRLRTGTDADRIKLLEFLSDIARDVDYSRLVNKIENRAPNARGWVMRYRALLRMRGRIRNQIQLNAWRAARDALLLAIANNEAIA